jgi:hypothetical protein
MPAQRHTEVELAAVFPTNELYTDAHVDFQQGHTIHATYV